MPIKSFASWSTLVATTPSNHVENRKKCTNRTPIELTPLGLTPLGQGSFASPSSLVAFVPSSHIQNGKTCLNKTTTNGLTPLSRQLCISIKSSSCHTIKLYPEWKETQLGYQLDWYHSQSNYECYRGKYEDKNNRLVLRHCNYFIIQPFVLPREATAKHSGYYKPSLWFIIDYINLHDFPWLYKVKNKLYNKFVVFSKIFENDTLARGCILVIQCPNLDFLECLF